MEKKTRKIPKYLSIPNLREEVKFQAGTSVGSVLLNIWEYCHRTVEVHRANELEPLSTSGERTPLCRLFARSKPGWSPREEWIGQFSKMFV